jgi:N6-L-threonylcarbamoyladenine synthase
MIWPVVDEALKTAGIKLEGLSGVAVCHGPGLIGSLLVGCSFAKALCYSKGIPLVAVNHLEGHIFSSFLEEPKPAFPFLALIASGGHTCLYRVDDFRKYRELGRTRDDASGEAYDKVAKLLGLGYPGGPIIERLAQNGNPEAIDFPRAYLPETFDFSFSGIKTAVLNYVKKSSFSQQSAISPPTHPSPSRGEGKGGGKSSELLTLNSQLSAFSQESNPPKPPFTKGGLGGITNSSLVTRHSSLADICASFQASVIDVLVKKTEWAIRKERIKRVILTGGVAANNELRKRMKEMCDKRGSGIFIPSAYLCTDNAAMIASAGYHHFKAGNFAGLDLNPQAYMPL